jgi:hypothetical protein
LCLADTPHDSPVYGGMNSTLSEPAFWSRFQFGFTLVYHYLFPQLTMGLSWFLVYWKWRALKTGDEKYYQAVRFWAKIFGLSALTLSTEDRATTAKDGATANTSWLGLATPATMTLVYLHTIAYYCT